MKVNERYPLNLTIALQAKAVKDLEENMVVVDNWEDFLKYLDQGKVGAQLSSYRISRCAYA